MSPAGSGSPLNVSQRINELKTVVLTTETLHHAYFVRELSRFHSFSRIFIESRVLPAPFETCHPYEDDRDRFELDFFFQGNRCTIKDYADVQVVDTINSMDALKSLMDISPDIVIVFGTGRLDCEVLRLCPGRTINLHGGDPEAYRGLDSHLWAIYHHDYKSLQTTLHLVNEKLDDGNIILREPLPLGKNMKLHEVRAVNTRVCINLVTRALETFDQHGSFPSRPQQRKGRYYSFMPACLKDICRPRFERYTERLQ